MTASRWKSKDYKTFRAGDIICEAERQGNLSLIIKTDDEAIWCVNLVLAAATEAEGRHPIYPMRLDEIEVGVWDGLMRLGNLDDYKEYIKRVESECTYEKSPC